MNPQTRVRAERSHESEEKMTGSWRGLVLVAGFVCVLAAVAGSATSAQARPDGPARAGKHTVKVGIVYSRSGLLANYGAMYAQGVRLGLEYMTKGKNTV